jgi:hypothetical protein
VPNLLGIAPFADRGCKAVFIAKNFRLYHLDTVILTGTRHGQNLWHIILNKVPTPTQGLCATTYYGHTEPVLLMHDNTRKNEDYVRLIHACMGHPTSTTFLQAVQRGYITAPNQFPRLTSKLVRKHMPSSEATAKGHLNKPPTSQPHIWNPVGRWTATITQQVTANQAHNHCTF